MANKNNPSGEGKDEEIHVERGSAKKPDRVLSMFGLPFFQQGLVKID